MTVLISSSNQFFKTPQNIRIDNRVFNDISYMITKKFVDNDGKTKTVKYMGGPNSNYVTYLEKNKITRSSENFYELQEMKLGDRIYKGVQSITTIPGKYDVYHINDSTLECNSVRVRKNGSITDINELKKKILKRKLTQPFKRLMQKLSHI